MVIELRVVRFWSEIILMTSNRIRAVRSFDFEITLVTVSRGTGSPTPTNYARMISDKNCTPLSSITIIYSL